MDRVTGHPPIALSKAHNSDSWCPLLAYRRRQHGVNTLLPATAPVQASGRLPLRYSNPRHRDQRPTQDRQPKGEQTRRFWDAGGASLGTVILAKALPPDNGRRHCCPLHPLVLPSTGGSTRSPRSQAVAPSPAGPAQPLAAPGAAQLAAEAILLDGTGPLGAFVAARRCSGPRSTPAPIARRAPATTKGRPRLEKAIRPAAARPLAGVARSVELVRATEVKAPHPERKGWTRVGKLPPLLEGRSTVPPVVLVETVRAAVASAHSQNPRQGVPWAAARVLGVVRATGHEGQPQPLEAPSNDSGHGSPTAPLCPVRP